MTKQSTVKVAAKVAPSTKTAKPPTAKSLANKAKHAKQWEETKAEMAKNRPLKVDAAKRAAQKSVANPLMLDGQSWNRLAVMAIICERTATCTKSLDRIVTEPFGEFILPSHGTIRAWMVEDTALYDMYAKSKAHQVELFIEETIQIADDGSNDTYTDRNGHQQTNYDVLGRSKLRIETRQWMAGKLKHRKYGTKLEVSGDPERPLSPKVLDPEKLKGMTKAELDAAIAVAEKLAGG